MKSIAVPPFNDLSAARDQEYFGDGLAEELLNVLVQVEGLSVASRTSSFAFKGKNLSVPAIAQVLGVAHIVEGSVRRAGNRLRVTAQLIDVATDRHLWSQTFDRDATDIFVIQDEIARSIADALKVRLGRAAESKPGTGSVAAYDQYLLGLYHWNQRTEEGLRKALQIFREASERDPTSSSSISGNGMLPVEGKRCCASAPMRSCRVSSARARSREPSRASPKTIRASRREWSRSARR